MTKQSIELPVPELNATVKIVARDPSEGFKEYDKKSRVHIWGVDALPEVFIESVTLPASKERGVDPENDKAYDRYNRLYGRAYKTLGELIIGSLALNPQAAFADDLKLRFSRVAGCSCGCSPGLVASHTLRYDGRPVDVYVTLHETQEPTV